MKTRRNGLPRALVPSLGATGRAARARALPFAALTAFVSLAADQTLAPKAAWAAPPAAPAPSGDELTMAVGEQRTLSAKDAQTFSISGDSINVNLSANKTEFVVAGKKSGISTLLIIKTDGSQFSWTINVTAKPAKEVEKEINSIIDGMSGVHVKKLGGRFILEGNASEADIKKIDKLVSFYPGQVESLVGSGPGADRKLLVRVDFFFVTYDRSSSYTVGLGLPTEFGGASSGNAAVWRSQVDFDLLSKTTTSATASIVNQPLPKLDIGSKHGWAKVLRQSTVISANGSEATFNSGGEQNFIQTVGISATLAKIQFGTNVTVLPRYDPTSKEVEVKVDSEISNLVSGEGSTLPGRAITKLSTLVTLKLGQALVLSGVRNQTERHEVSGVVGLSSIPVLGLLFGTHNNAAEDQDGAIFIIPSLIETVPKSSLEVVQAALASYERFEGDVERAQTFTKKPPSAN